MALWLGAANRDSERFDEPEQFDLRRKSSPHLAFGYGIHSCLGASLARMVGAVAIGMLTRAVPCLQLAAGSLEWYPDLNIRGLDSLPVIFG